MAVIVKHTKVSAVADGADTSVVRPSDWNADHTLTGLGTAASLDAGVANGVASLDSAGTVPIGQLPAAVLGALSYQGTWDASTNTPTLTSSTGTKGYYYVVSVAGSTNLNGITDWKIGDWAVFNGSVWQKIDNTDSVTSVNGYTGAVNLTYTDVGAFPATGTTGTGNVVLQTNPLLITPTLSGATVDNAAPYLNFANGSAVTLAAGRMWYDGATGAWNLGMGGGNITQQVGEEFFVYGKASTAITDSPLQIVYQTGVVGASGAITFAPTIAGITNGGLILGCATENIALNNFGRITSLGVIRGITANGTAFGETWANGDTIWYNPVTGNPTNVKPVAPNVKISVGTIINAGAGGSGSIQVEVSHGSFLGGTDSNVQLTSVANNDLLQYDSTAQYWKNVPSTSVAVTSFSAGTTGLTPSTGTTGAVTLAGTLGIANGGTGATTAATARTALGLGTIATQDANAVAVTGGTINGTTVGSTTAAAGSFTTLNSSGATRLGGLSGNQSLQVNNVASAVNYLQAVGAVTGGAPTLSALGTDANIGLSLASKGTSGVTIDSTTATNFLTMNDGATTRFSFVRDAAGSGSVIKINSGVASIVTTDSSTGTLSFKTNTTQEQVRISPTASAVNYVNLTGAATGAAPTISAQGSDANINLNLTPKGTGSVTINATTAITVPAGTTAQRPTGATGMFRYNSTTAGFEGYNGTVWGAIGGGSNITTLGLWENASVIAANYTIGTGNNATSAGPITINSGVVVTVPSGSTWVIV